MRKSGSGRIAAVARPYVQTALRRTARTGSGSVGTYIARLRMDSFLAVGPRLVDKRFEEPQILGFLRMPENAEREAPLGVFDRLERAVLGPRRFAETRTKPAEPLVVMRLHGRAFAEKVREARARLEVDVVVCELAGRVFVLLVSHDFRQVLDEIAAESDVHHLAPAADRQHREVALERAL